jgi:fructokinase
MTAARPLLCGVELGGSKCVCLVGTGPDDIRSQVSVPTTSDARATLERLAQALGGLRAAHGAFAAIGLASFGPLELRRSAAAYGRIALTPKEGWSHVDVGGYFAARFAEPVGISTDVIAAALAEGRWGAARGLADFAYVTVGTGVGAGLIAGGRPLLGSHHPELGHLRIVRAAGDSWPGVCPFHGDCVEGLASGPAIAARCGTPPAELPPDSPVWDGVAHALAQLAHALVLTVAPARILIGGGVACAQPALFPRIRARLVASLGGYLDIGQLQQGLGELVVPPGLGTLAGPLGALAVAADTAPPSSGMRPGPV